MMKFAVNCGSSSIKFSLYDSNSNPVATGSAKDILGPTASISITNLVSPTAKSLKMKIPQTTTYQEVFTKLIRELSTEHDLSHLDLIAHRIVHGGSCLSPIVLHDLSDKHLQEMDEVSTFAPLHNHHAMLIVRACLEKFPLVRNVLAFDTLFHQTIPEFRYTYAVAKNDNPSPVPLRRWGFHGLSYASVLRQMSQALNKPQEEMNLIVAHLGSGASVCLIQNGKSCSTSMGLTPLEGLVGGTRSGDIDPSLIFHHTPDCSTTVEWNGKAISKAEYVLNKESGLLALTGTTFFGTIVSRAFDPTFGCPDSDRPPAKLAYDLYLDRLVSYLSSYLSHLFSSSSPPPELDALVFSGGIGEHSSRLRADVLRSVGGWIEALAVTGGGVDEAINEGDLDKGGPRRITKGDCKVPGWVVWTDEERECVRLGVEAVEREEGGRRRE